MCTWKNPTTQTDQVRKLPQKAIFLKLGIFQNWQLSSGRRFRHRKPIILEQSSKQINFPFITLFWIFLAWHCNCFKHLFVPLVILFVFCVHLRLCCWISAVLCITQTEPTTPRLRQFQACLLPCGSQIASSLDDSSVPVCEIQGETCPVKTEQRAFSVIPALSELSAAWETPLEFHISFFISK